MVKSLLAFTRLLFHEPVLAVLDEATSALSQVCMFVHAKGHTSGRVRRIKLLFCEFNKFNKKGWLHEICTGIMQNTVVAGGKMKY